MADEANEPEPEICDNCAYPAPLTEYENNDFSGGEFKEVKHWFCDVCASTYLSRATTNLQQYGSQAALFQSLGYIANMVLDEIRKSQPDRKS